jgi:hypothetical protein
MRRTSRIAVALVVLAAMGLVLAVPAFALSAAPTLLLALLLSAGRHPGERTIERWRDRRRPARPPRGVTKQPRPSARRAPARGRLIICFSLANRPPPVLVLSA